MTKITYKSKDWNVDTVTSAVTHKSGLTLRVEKKKAAGDWPVAIDIRGLSSLHGTPWAQQANTLVEEGIALLGV